ncbi:MAG: hypothetical protein ACR2NX_04225 [Chthoniobacterales bacterium]
MFGSLLQSGREFFHAGRRPRTDWWRSLRRATQIFQGIGLVALAIRQILLRIVGLDSHCDLDLSGALPPLHKLARNAGLDLPTHLENCIVTQN